MPYLPAAHGWSFDVDRSLHVPDGVAGYSAHDALKSQPCPCIRFMTKRLLLCIFLLPGCSDMSPDRVEITADSAAGEVDFEMAGPGGAALIVPVHINGSGPFDFVLDTGATITCVDEQLSAQLSLPAVRGVIGTAAGVGGQGELSLVEIDSLSMGGVSAHGLEACVINLEHLSGMGLELDGLIGLNVLREFRVTLDFERSIVTLEDP